MNDQRHASNRGAARSMATQMHLIKISPGTLPQKASLTFGSLFETYASITTRLTSLLALIFRRDIAQRRALKVLVGFLFAIFYTLVASENVVAEPARGSSYEKRHYIETIVESYLKRIGTDSSPENLIRTCEKSNNCQSIVVWGSAYYFQKGRYADAKKLLESKREQFSFSPDVPCSQISLGADENNIVDFSYESAIYAIDRQTLNVSARMSGLDAFICEYLDGDSFTGNLDKTNYDAEELTQENFVLFNEREYGERHATAVERFYTEILNPLTFARYRIDRSFDWTVPSEDAKGYIQLSVLHQNAYKKCVFSRMPDDFCAILERFSESYRDKADEAAKKWGEKK